LNEIQVISPFFRHRALAEPSSSEIKNLPIRLGEILRGTVVQSLDPHRAWMKFGDQTILVESQIPLPQNTELAFVVKEIQPQIILKLLDGHSADPQVASLLKKYFSSDVPLEKILEQLSSLWGAGKEKFPPSLEKLAQQFRAFIERFSFPRESSPNAQALRDLVADSGLFWEARIKQWIEGGKNEPFVQLLQRDFKGFGLKFLAQLEEGFHQMKLESEEFQAMRELLGGLEGILRKIEFYQILTHQPPEGQERIFLLLPFWLGTHLQFVELCLSFPREKEKASEEEEQSLLFLLQLPALGKLRVEVKINQKNLYCVFLSPDPQISRFIQDAIPVLERELKNLGFQPHIQTGAQSPEKWSLTFLAEVEQDLQSLLSITV
jgi:hypothetical protein